MHHATATCALTLAVQQLKSPSHTSPSHNTHVLTAHRQRTHLDNDSSLLDGDLLGVAADGELVLALIARLHPNALEGGHTIAQRCTVAAGG